MTRWTLNTLLGLLKFIGFSILAILILWDMAYCYLKGIKSDE